MFIVVFGTFITAGFANFGADAADRCCPATTQAHEFGCSFANSRTFHIELNTCRHHLNILFLCAGRSTVVTNGCAPQAGFYTILVSVIILLHKLVLVQFHKTRAVMTYSGK
jgi:hypothetical protein